MKSSSDQYIPISKVSPEYANAPSHYANTPVIPQPTTIYANTSNMSFIQNQSENNNPTYANSSEIMEKMTKTQYANMNQ